MTLRDVGRWLLAGFLVFAGVSHFANAEEFLAQVPSWLPWRDGVVAVSGVVEIALGLALVALPRHRQLAGWCAAAFFVAVFPGNIAQFVEGTDAFGLDSDAARGVRLLFQPLLVLWALWCTGAWPRPPCRRRRTDRGAPGRQGSLIVANSGIPARIRSDQRSGTGVGGAGAPRWARVRYASAPTSRANFCASAKPVRRASRSVPASRIAWLAASCW